LTINPLFLANTQVMQNITQGEIATRIVYILVMAALAISISSPVLLLLFLFLHIIALLGFRAKLERGYWLTLVLFFMLIQLIFQKGGDELLGINITNGYHIAAITSGGVISSLTTGIRLFIVLSSGLMLANIQGMRLMQVLLLWKFPSELAMLFVLTTGFIPLLRNRVNEVLISIQLRGIDLRALSLRKKIGLFEHLLYPIFISCLLRAKAIAAALEIRGYAVAKRPTFIEEIDYGYKDILMQVFIVVSAILVYILKWKVLYEGNFLDCSSFRFW
jgi:energy-coupling factor transport system permease protein